MFRLVSWAPKKMDITDFEKHHQKAGDIIFDRNGDKVFVD
jgi:hypothetical protein